MQTIDRIIMVGRHRLANLPLSLSYDHLFVPGFRNSTIVSPLKPPVIRNVLESNSVDTSGYSYVTDEDIIESMPQLKKWKPLIDSKYQGHADAVLQMPQWSRYRTWSKQQALKLALVSTSDADYTLIQDVDAFPIRPYHMLNNNVANIFVRNDDVDLNGCMSLLDRNCIVSLFKQPLVVSHNYTTELFLTIRESVQDLVQFIENTYNLSFHDALWANALGYLYNFGDAPSPLRIPVVNEYSLLGHWLSLQTSQGKINNKYQYQKQYRFEFNGIHCLEYLSALKNMHLKPLDPSWYDYVNMKNQPQQLCHHLNVVVDQSHQTSMSVDPKTYRVKDLVRYKQIVDDYILGTSQ